MQKLTKAEEEIMLALWELEEAVVRDVMAELKDPNIPYTTVSTVIRVLEKKGFIGHKSVGNTYIYFPLISKKKYLKDFLPGILRKYFNGSFTEMTSFFAHENDMSLAELSEIIEVVGEELKEKNGNSKKKLNSHE
ncbi:MAG: BlaI/MecI/CopY family transcriptional regulator [Bacteroidales bacterium]|nr:BlaI/MecI/CopY family transcriptional regulator [Bacteroidales bacterium]MCF8405887.1 BlaI/MecI/CopY family transcriptional regulator [Bacteroidales bacterium]